MDSVRSVDFRRRAPAAADSPADIQKRIDAEKQAIYDLQQELIPLLRRGEPARLEAQRIEAAIAARSEVMASHQQELAAAESGAAGPDIQQQLQFLQSALDDRDNRISELTDVVERMRSTQQQESLPPLPNAVTRVYKLRYATPSAVANVLNDVLGPAVIRVAVDENRLIVASADATFDQIEQLVQSLDEPVASDAVNVQEQREENRGSPRALLGARVLAGRPPERRRGARSRAIPARWRAQRPE